MLSSCYSFPQTVDVRHPSVTREPLPAPLSRPGLLDASSFLPFLPNHKYLYTCTVLVHLASSSSPPPFLPRRRLRIPSTASHDISTSPPTAATDCWEFVHLSRRPRIAPLLRQPLSRGCAAAAAGFVHASTVHHVQSLFGNVSRSQRLSVDCGFLLRRSFTPGVPPRCAPSQPHIIREEGGSQF